MLARLALWLEDLRIALDTAALVFAMMLARRELDPLERFRQVGAAMTVAATRRQQEIATEQMLAATPAKRRAAQTQP